MYLKKEMKIVVTYLHPVLEETARGILNLIAIENPNYAVDLVKNKGLLLPACRENLYIVVGPHFKLYPAYYILYQVEQLSSHWLTPQYIAACKGALAVWDFSPFHCHFWTEVVGIQAVKYIPLPSAPHTHAFQPNDDPIDVLFYGGPLLRREKMYEELCKKLPHRKIIFRVYDLFGQERESMIDRAKIVLNIHYWPYAALEVHRIEHLLSRNKCVVSEPSFDRELDLLYSDAVVFCPLDKFCDTIEHLLDSPEERMRCESAGRGIVESNRAKACIVVNEHVKDVLQSIDRSKVVPKHKHHPKLTLPLQPVHETDIARYMCDEVVVYNTKFSHLKTFSPMGYDESCYHVKKI
jgi:hypothetical protein